MLDWNEIFDVVVVGSGASGVTAGLAAQHAGTRAVVIERSDKYGGTSAVSAGVPWIPNNHHAHEIGVEDSREKALTYLRSLSKGGMDMDVAEAFVDEGPRMIRFVEEQTPLRFRALKLPDYHPEHPGGGIGRSLTPGLFPGAELGEMRSALRPGPCFPIPISMGDLEDGVNLFDPELIGDRLARGMVGAGMALMAGLIKGAVDKGVEFRRNLRVTRLVIEDDVVIGIESEGEHGLVRIGARRGVILASGGFEWNEQLVADNLRGPVDGALSPPFNEGDGLIMAMEAKAAIANTREAWWMPMLQIPGDEYEGRQLNRTLVTERFAPHSIIVNRKGKRFMNEAQNYNDMGRTMHNFDPMAFDYPNLPAWIIMDQDYLDNFMFGTHFPGDQAPKWMHSAPTLRELAENIGVDPEGLEDTVVRFNANAARGEDPDFDRGISIYDLYYGDPSREGAKRTLGEIEKAPFYACQIQSGVLGTKGGPKINGKAEVVGLRGGRVTGLYAAGNVCAGLNGMAYPGAGATIGPGMTFGMIAGREAASCTNRF